MLQIIYYWINVRASELGCGIDMHAGNEDPGWADVWWHS